MFLFFIFSFFSAWETLFIQSFIRIIAKIIYLDYLLDALIIVRDAVSLFISHSLHNLHLVFSWLNPFDPQYLYEDPNDLIQ